jgi:heme a synthase
VLVLQVALGGWAGTNHPATDCPDQTDCQQQGGAANDHRDGFSPWRDAGVASGSGVPEAAVPDATRFTHRIGAVVTLLAVGGLALLLLWRGGATVRAAAAAVMAFLLIQLSLEISGLVFPLPLPVAVAHNVAAALLLLAVVTLLHVLRQPVTHRLRLEGPLNVTVDTWPPELPGRGGVWRRTPQNKSPDWRGIE